MKTKRLYSEGIHKVIIEVVLVLQRTVCCSSNHLPEGYLTCHLCCSSEMDLLKQKNTLLSSMEAEKRSLEAELQDIQSQLTGKTGLCSFKNFLWQHLEISMCQNRPLIPLFFCSSADIEKDLKEAVALTESLKTERLMVRQKPLTDSTCVRQESYHPS